MLSDAVPDEPPGNLPVPGLPPAMAQLSALRGIADLRPPARKSQEAGTWVGGDGAPACAGVHEHPLCCQLCTLTPTPLTQPFQNTDHWPRRDPPHSKAGHLAPETHTSHSFYPSYLLFSSYPTPAVYSLNHNQATRPPAPNTISTAAGPHRGPGLDPAPTQGTAGHSSAQTPGPFC